MFELLRRRLGRPLATSRWPAAPAPVAPGARTAPVLDPSRCDVNGACAAVCPTGAITIAEAVRLDQGACISCHRCIEVCPTGALTAALAFEEPRRAREALIVPAISRAGDGSDLGRRARSVLGRSLHVRHLDAGSCNGCDWEITATANAVHDLQRFGIDFVASPRHADVLLVTGTMTRNLEVAARATWDAMSDPRLVVAVGACAVSGSPYPAGYASGDGAAGTLPVDVFVPGCPPRPEQIIAGLLLAVDRLARP